MSVPYCIFTAMTNRTSRDEVTYLRPGEAARILAVHERTLTRMAKRGQVKSITLPSGHRRYEEAGILALAAPPADPP